MANGKKHKVRNIFESKYWRDNPHLRSLVEGTIRAGAVVGGATALGTLYAGFKIAKGTVKAGIATAKAVRHPIKAAKAIPQKLAERKAKKEAAKQAGKQALKKGILKKIGARFLGPVGAAITYAELANFTEQLSRSLQYKSTISAAKRLAKEIKKKGMTPELQKRVKKLKPFILAVSVDYYRKEVLSQILGVKAIGFDLNRIAPGSKLALQHLDAIHSGGRTSAQRDIHNPKKRKDERSKNPTKFVKSGKLMAAIVNANYILYATGLMDVGVKAFPLKRALIETEKLQSPKKFYEKTIRRIKSKASHRITLQETEDLIDIGKRLGKQKEVLLLLEKKKVSTLKRVKADIRATSAVDIKQRKERNLQIENQQEKEFNVGSYGRTLKVLIQSEKGKKVYILEEYPNLKSTNKAHLIRWANFINFALKLTLKKGIEHKNPFYLSKGRIYFAQSWSTDTRILSAAGWAKLKFDPKKSEDFIAALNKIYHKNKK